MFNYHVYFFDQGGCGIADYAIEVESDDVLAAIKDAYEELAIDMPGAEHEVAELRCVMED